MNNIDPSKSEKVYQNFDLDEQGSSQGSHKGKRVTATTTEPSCPETDNLLKEERLFSRKGGNVAAKTRLNDSGEKNEVNDIKARIEELIAENSVLESKVKENASRIRNSTVLNAEHNTINKQNNTQEAIDNLQHANQAQIKKNNILKKGNKNNIDGIKHLKLQLEEKRDYNHNAKKEINELKVNLGKDKGSVVVLEERLLEIKLSNATLASTANKFAELNVGDKKSVVEDCNIKLRKLNQDLSEKHNDLVVDIKKIEAINESASEISMDLSVELDKQKQIFTKLNRNVENLDKLKTELIAKTKENNKLNNLVDLYRKSINKLSEDVKLLDDKHNSYTKKAKENKDYESRLDHYIKNTNLNNNKMRKEIEELNSKHNAMKENLEHGSHEQEILCLENKRRSLIEDLVSKENKFRTEASEDLIVLMEENKKLEKNKNDMLNYLSKVAGAKLKNNNPGITDLSDPNRPTKIGERFSELYDGLWTDAMEGLEDCPCPEETSIYILRDIVINSKNMADDLVKKRRKNIANIIGVKELDKITAVERAGINEFVKYSLWKEMFTEDIDTIILNIMNMVKSKHGEEIAQKIELLCREVARLTVQMSWQNPPMFIKKVPNKGDDIDKDEYKVYTKSGVKVDFVVWPALFLHEGGPLLNKGVCQPYESSS